MDKMDEMDEMDKMDELDNRFMPVLSISSIPSRLSIPSIPPSFRHRLWRWTRRVLIASAILLVLVTATLAYLWHRYPFPMQKLAAAPISPVVTDRGGHPLLQRVSADDQWRIVVPLEQVSPWLIQATIAAEDHRFRSHFGVDVLAAGRAAGSNLLAGRTVSGASTLTMQVCRMMEDRPRTLWAKAVESFRAVQLERLWTKEQILEHYLNVAPYGGNLRGVQAASLAYFHKDAADLSLAEAALLAALPQSPARYRPDRRLQLARQRQRVVLERMVKAGFITREQAEQAAGQEIQLAPPAREILAPHAAWLALARRPAGGRTTIDLAVQQAVETILDQRSAELPAGVQQAAVVIDIEESAIVAMVGSAAPEGSQHNAAVARRSPGSALKPFIYAAAFEAGRLNADATVYDVPIQRGGWEPENFTRTFAGPLPAGEALRRSLNVPAILTAEGTGLARCLGVMEACGLGLPPGSAGRGGLAVAVGGIEVTLLDLTNAYATLGRGGLMRRPRLLADEAAPPQRALGAEICRSIDEILCSRRRRPAGMQALDDSAVPWFMWKTGTSAGRRDAWAVGHNGRFAVGVWAGAVRGSGHPELVGSQAAEPALAAIFNLPALRRPQADPPPPPVLAVRFPLPPPQEAGAALCILSPGAGETLIAPGGPAVVRPRANRDGELAWFLNGQLLSRSDRLELGRGLYELRCVDAAGNSSAVRFAVR